jgi:predicted ribosomally synthesized peptide with nif11-like leader
MENAKAFYEKVMKDQDLFNKIGQIQQETLEGIEIEIVKIAAENKCDFTVEEMKAFLESEAKKRSSSGELSDSELEAVAGGKNIGNWIGNSILTGGFACALSGIMHAENQLCYDGMD